jgi:LacI family transcriptional regulator
MMVRPTLADLARAAGVGMSTVDRVLNGRDPVRRSTAERVLAAAEQIGFYATGAIRQRLGADRPDRTFGFVLQQRSMPFYAQLGEALAEATKAATAISGRPRIDFLDDLTPDSVAEHLMAAGKDADALAVVSAEHPRVTQAIEHLGSRGVPVFALISDLSAPALAGYIGLDNWKVGRTAAWAVANLCKRPGHVGIFVGSHRYRCQEACEMSFRSYFREHAPDFQLLEPRTSLEDVRYAYENALDLLKRDPDLVGLFVAGGGVEGVMRALRDENAAERVVTIGLDLTEETRSGLIDGVLKLVLSHPRKTMAETAVQAMARAVEQGRHDSVRQMLLPFEFYTSENL